MEVVYFLAECLCMQSVHSILNHMMKWITYNISHVTLFTNSVTFRGIKGREGLCTVTLPIPVFRRDYVSNNAIKMHIFPLGGLYQKGKRKAEFKYYNKRCYSHLPI